MKIDPYTGLPQLPKDHFWRLKEPFDSINGPLMLEIRRNRRVGSKTLLRTRLNSSDELRAKAEFLWERWEKHSKDYEAMGDYPPKKWEAN